MMIKKNHSFHMVDQSPWPLMGASAALILTSGIVKWFQEFSFKLMALGLISLLVVCIQWWRDVSRESAYQGLHTKIVVGGLKWGMILFITSEILFFFSFFWSFFHSSLAPSMEIGLQWPPLGILVFNPFQIPLLNTLILLSSGVTITWAHHSIINKNHSNAKNGLKMTVLLGLIFTGLQTLEYWEATFTIADSSYGATFFTATGFHGLHVIIGTTFLMVCLYRLSKYQFSSQHHFGFEAAAWYWHFVDVVWLFLFMTIYWWGA